MHIYEACLCLLIVIVGKLQASQLIFQHDVKGALYPSTHVKVSTAVRQSVKCNIALSTRWSSIGPFSSGMREHQMGALAALALHPLASVFNMHEPVLIPSAYGHAAFVSAKELHSTNLTSGKKTVGSKGSSRQSLQVSYPDIDWSLIKLSVGWAGLQWEALSVTNLTVQGQDIVTMALNIDKAASFAILSEEEYLRHDWENTSSPIRWYNGDMYSYNKEPLGNHDEAPTHLIRIAPGYYKLLLKSVYEIRVLGSGHKEGPSIEHIIDFYCLDDKERITAITVGQYGVMPDIVDGNLAGWGVSFALRNNRDEWTEILEVYAVGEICKSLSVALTDAPLRLAPLQTRPIEFRFIQMTPISQDFDELILKVRYRSVHSPMISTKEVRLGLKHTNLFQSSSSEVVSYKFTFLDSDNTLQYAAIVPPRIFNSSDLKVSPALVYLHGAGVDVRTELAQKALLQQNTSWIIHPSGRSPWGLDWQMNLCSPLSALKAFANNMYGLAKEVRDMATKIDAEKFMIAGHSNGGQGTLHISTRYPDSILGAVVGAPYLSLSNYVPLTWQQGRHHNDAALSGILKSSLNLFENNLYASNLAGIPMLFKYGTLDDNVPTWHTKEMVSLMSQWNRQSNAVDELIDVSEVANRSHYWDEFMREDDVQSKLENTLRNSSDNPFPGLLSKFTLHVFNPEDSGSKQGWRIKQIEIPGRMSRLEVQYIEKGRISVQSSNAQEISLERREKLNTMNVRIIDIDGSTLDISSLLSSTLLNFYKNGKEWKHGVAPSLSRSMGPMIRFLSSSGPIKIILPTQCPPHLTQQYLSIAHRFALDSYLYNRIDCNIFYDSERLALDRNDYGNMLLLGGPTINLISRLSSASQSVIAFINDSCQFSIQDRHYAKDTTLLSLLPHPLITDSYPQDLKSLVQLPMALLLHGTDAAAIEKGYNLLPVRTGTLLPEWIVVDRSSEWKGYGGVVGAGWFNNRWGWSESMSYLI